MQKILVLFVLLCAAESCYMCNNSLIVTGLTQLPIQLQCLPHTSLVISRFAMSSDEPLTATVSIAPDVYTYSGTDFEATNIGFEHTANWTNPGVTALITIMCGSDEDDICNATYYLSARCLANTANNWYVSPWSNCSSACYVTRGVLCMTPTLVPAPSVSCYDSANDYPLAGLCTGGSCVGTYNWSVGLCGLDCTRNVTCVDAVYGMAVSNDYCPGLAPSSVCSCAGAAWVNTQWSNCSSMCQKIRPRICMSGSYTLDNVWCNDSFISSRLCYDGACISNSYCVSNGSTGTSVSACSYCDCTNVYSYSDRVPVWNCSRSACVDWTGATVIASYCNTSVCTEQNLFTHSDSGLSFGIYAGIAAAGIAAGLITAMVTYHVMCRSKPREPEVQTYTVL